MTTVVVAGARPNFVKIAPLLRRMEQVGMAGKLVHTGQHYDAGMSGSFFEELGIREPDANLEIGSGTHASQTALVLERFASWIEGQQGVERIVVVGDVNSTVACTLVGAKLQIPVAHVEAGLRSFDRTMPEEINRVVVDALATWLLTPSPDADANLLREGAHPSRIVRVGNIMVDSLLGALERAHDRPVCDRLGLDGRYGLVTLHRPALVDDDARLSGVLGALAELSRNLPLVFPVHPRTRARLRALDGLPPTLHLVEPLGYLDFVHIEANAALVLTDSGGVQEETTCLGVPCLTLRDNTERPITVTEGTNRVIGTDPSRILAEAEAALGASFTARRPDLWDGRTAERVVDAIARLPAGEYWAPA